MRSCFYLMITPCYYDHIDFDYSISEHSRVLTGHFFFFFLFLCNVLKEKNESSVLSKLKNNKYLWSQVQQISLRMGGRYLIFCYTDKYHQIVFIPRVKFLLGSILTVVKRLIYILWATWARLLLKILSLF